MGQMKVADVARTAALLKKLIEKVDTNKDGSVSNGDVRAISPRSPRDPNVVPRQADLKSAVHGAQRYAQSKGSTSVAAVKKAVDEIAAAVKKADRDGDGVVSEAEYRSLATLAAKRFVDFGQVHAKDKTTDFKLEPQRDTPRPKFRWTGTIPEVTTSLLMAHSDRQNDSWWPSWGSPEKTPSRFVISKAEAEAMVKALEPLYASRQKGVITELSSRSQQSRFGCVSVDAKARAVFEQYADRLGVRGLTFGSPAAPKLPSS
jgi:hypothetical protein